MRGDPTKAIGIRIPLRLIPTLEEEAAARGTGLSAHLSNIVVDVVEQEGRAYATAAFRKDPPEPARQEGVEAQAHRHRRKPTGQVRFERGAKQEHAVCATCGKDMGWK